MKTVTIQLKEDLHEYPSVERWLNYVYSSGIRSTSTEKTYLHFLRRFCVFTAKTPEDLIEERKEHMRSDDQIVNSQHEVLLQQWRDSMEADPERPLARGSVVTGHNIIRSFYLAQGNKLALLAKSPKSWKTRESSSVVPSPQEFAKIMKKAKNLRDQTYIICLAQTGISLQDFTELIFYGNIKRELEQGIEPLHVPMKRQKIGEYKYDSVPGYSPIIVRYNDLIDVVSFDDLWDLVPGQTSQTEQGEEIKDVLGLDTMRPEHTNGWTSIQKIIRHPFSGSLVRINAAGGLVDTSPNHSIMPGLNSAPPHHPIEAAKIKVGDFISIRSIVVHQSNPTFVGSKDLGWLYGLFAAEGSANNYPVKATQKKAGYTSFPVTFSNKNKSLLEKADGIICDQLNVSTSLTLKDDANQLRFQSKPIDKMFRQMFYTKDGKKKVPRSILNAPPSVQEEFLKGYLEGDGSKSYGRFSHFTTNSQTLAMGLIFLLKQLHKADTIRIHSRDDKPDCNQIYWPHPQNTLHNHDPLGIVRKIKRINYDGWLYDVVTSSHTFTTGIGPVRVHNTFLGEDALSYLRRYLKDTRFKDQEPIFNLSPRAIEYVVKRTSIRAGLKPHITPHRERAFFSTYMGLSFHTQDTKHLLLVEHWMGHKLPYAGTYMVPPVDIQRSIYKQHEYAVSISPNGINFEEKQ